MKSIASLFLLLVIPSFLYANADTVSYAAFFDTDKHQLTIEEQQRLRQWLGTLYHDEYIFTLHGHTDIRGSHAYNQALSERRVGQVADFLQKEGIASAVITSAAYGEKLPASFATSALAHQKNRRVYIVARPLVIQTIADLDSLLLQNTEKIYSIDPSKPCDLKGYFGTNVHIPANVFGVASEENIQVTVREAVKLEHLMALGLSTRTANNVLETGGMIYIEAKNLDGEVISLMPDAEVAISFPTNEVKPGMQLFTSEVGGTNWEQEVTVDEIAFETFYPDPIETAYVRTSRADVHQKTVFVELAKPVMPSPPMKPSKPRAVDESRYVKEIKWYHLNKGKRHLENARALQLADRHLDTRELRYQRAMVAYEKAMLNYSRAVDEYHLKMREWNDKGGVDTVKKMVSYRRCARVSNGLSTLSRLEYDAAKHYNDKMFKERVAYLEATGGATFEDVQQYVLTTNTLGWINCDRIPQEYKGKRRLVSAETKDNEMKRVILVFDEHDVVMNFSMDTEMPSKYHVNQIPDDAQVSVFSYKVQNGRPYIALVKGIEARNLDLEYRQSSFAEISSLLANL